MCTNFKRGIKQAEIEPSACASEREKGIGKAMWTDIYSVFNPPKKIELGPCPFCGSKAISISVPENGCISGDTGTRATIVCESRECGARIVKWALKKEWAEESAVKAWNNRANQQHEVGES